MKKIIVLFLMFFGFFATAQDGAKIEFKEETINYGEVVRGEDSGERIFEYTNTGNADLYITNAKSSCGCTVPEWTKEAVKPGGTGTLKVKYNMNPGPISKTITVETNAVNKNGGVVALRIKGTVIVKEATSPLEKKKTLPQS